NRPFADSLVSGEQDQPCFSDDGQPLRILRSLRNHATWPSGPRHVAPDVLKSLSYADAVLVEEPARLLDGRGHVTRSGGSGRVAVPMLEGDSLLDMLHRHRIDLRDALWVLARVHELSENLGVHTDRRDCGLAEALLGTEHDCLLAAQ